jgi:hypothetical protein
MERLRMERLRKTLSPNWNRSKNGITQKEGEGGAPTGMTQNRKPQNEISQKEFKPQLESRRVERLRMERLSWGLKSF